MQGMRTRGYLLGVFEGVSEATRTPVSELLMMHVQRRVGTSSSNRRRIVFWIIFPSSPSCISSQQTKTNEVKQTMPVALRVPAILSLPPPPPPPPPPQDMWRLEDKVEGSERLTTSGGSDPLRERSVAPDQKSGKNEGGKGVWNRGRKAGRQGGREGGKEGGREGGRSSLGDGWDTIQ